MDVLDKVLSKHTLLKKEKEQQIYLPHVIKITISDGGHLQDGGLSAVVVYIMWTHIEPLNIEVLLELENWRIGGGQCYESDQNTWRIKAERERHTRINKQNPELNVVCEHGAKRSV